MKTHCPLLLVFSILSLIGSWIKWRIKKATADFYIDELTFTFNYLKATNNQFIKNTQI